MNKKLMFLIGVLFFVILSLIFAIILNQKNESNCETLSSPDNSSQVEICDEPNLIYYQINSNSTCNVWFFDGGELEICDQLNKMEDNKYE